MIRINAVAICESKDVQYTRIPSTSTSTTAYHMQSPEGRTTQCQRIYAQVRNVFQKYKRSTWIKGPVNMCFCYFPVKKYSLPSIVPDRSERYLPHPSHKQNIRMDFHHNHMHYSSVPYSLRYFSHKMKSVKISDFIRSLQDCTRFNVKINM